MDRKERKQFLSTDKKETETETTTESTDEPAKPEKLIVWEDTDKSIGLKPAIESFEKEYGIKVEFKELDMADKMRDQLRLDGPSGTGADVVTLPHDQIGQVVTEGLIQEIDVSDDVLATLLNQLLLHKDTTASCMDYQKQQKHLYSSTTRR